ncbi:MAG TPA: amidohydrolase family protein [Rhodothermales bacterium]|nr:amidohydrolase family protein [Rhodothermales bacterium]
MSIRSLPSARLPLSLILSLFLLVTGCCGQNINVSPPPVIAYENGWWFNGSGFERRTMYVSGAFFVAPVRAAAVVDLGGAWIVPPFAEAHNHNVEPSSRVDAVLQSYLADGVFYVQNPNSVPRARDELDGRINLPGAIDVAFAFAGLTGPGGHPRQLADRNVARGNWSAEDAEGGFYLTISDHADLDRAWPALLRTKTDLVKVYLLDSAAYEAALPDRATEGWRGIDPALLPEIVKRAGVAGLPVAAHIETAEDFRVAVAAGVDQIVHMPGFRGDRSTTLPDPAIFRISDEDAENAARASVAVVTTVSSLALHADDQSDATLRHGADLLHSANLRTLRHHGVRLLIGSDDYSGTSVAEALYLYELGIFTSAELLHIWSVDTPQAIFPTRSIGRLEPGYEASFLALAANPLDDFRNIRGIRVRVKQGRSIKLAE